MVQKAKSFYKIISGIIASIFFFTPLVAKSKDVSKSKNTTTKTTSDKISQIKLKESVGDLAYRHTMPPPPNAKKEITMKFVEVKEQGKTVYRRVGDVAIPVEEAPRKQRSISIIIPKDIKAKTTLEGLEDIDEPTLVESDGKLFLLIPQLQLIEEFEEKRGR